MSSEHVILALGLDFCLQDYGLKSGLGSWEGLNFSLSEDEFLICFTIGW